MSDELAGAVEPGKLDLDGVRATFQGGGAKGVVHVGALMALEELGLPVVAAAGTSAGAMVAALVAAGYTAAELLDPESRKHILDRLADPRFKRATHLFGRGGWLAIACLRQAARYRYVVLAIALLMWLALGMFDARRPLWAMGLGFLALGAIGAGFALALQGIASVRHVRNFIDVAIRDKIAQRQGIPRDTIPENLSFRHLDQYGCIGLKIVATNVTDEVGEVFSLQRTPDVAVADAVAASICLPVIFRPWRFNCVRGSGVSADAAMRSFQDGGLISNLPVWTLADEVQSDRVVTIAFGIRQPLKHRDRFWFTALASSVVSGTMELDTHGVEMVHVPIQCEMDTLAFDDRLDDLCQVVKNTKARVVNRIIEDCQTFPRILAVASDDVQEAVTAVLKSYEANWLVHGGAIEVVVALAMQERGNYSDYVVGYPSKSSPLPEVPFETLSEAWESNQYSLEKFTQAGGSIWTGPYWRLVVPVSARTDPDVVPLVDGQRERPLVFIIEFEATPRTDPDTSAQFTQAVGAIAPGVIAYSQEQGLYSVVQRVTSTPWH
ncbi:patatin-like phospholipase family protein [Paraburkholderia tagetis]|uniref:Patatin-like phospholipase family protein n=1 Tax=Paraburkholderia tagetis TaxID=2913261 RepID=A0A9X1UJD2_9BURK|nr:patatin-like phospholipase family protein [Paraburkholderia tagetis]MCG5076357.1 patatin-like phospholipase family protein [Paraburkholderia tagetis]